jgi:hypothetical protein
VFKPTRNHAPTSISTTRTVSRQRTLTRTDVHGGRVQVAAPTLPRHRCCARNSQLCGDICPTRIGGDRAAADR